MHTDSWRKNLKERDHLEARRVNCKIILKYILKSSLGGRGLDLSDTG